MPTVPTRTTAEQEDHLEDESRRTLCGRLTDGRAARARMAAPTTRVAPPVKATRPFQPDEHSRRRSPWSASNAAMTENAVPTRTVRASLRRAPTTVSATAAAVAATAVKPTP